jgi:DNA-nicking Smr family endonuclease
MDDEDHKLWKHITQGLRAIENNLFHQKAAVKPIAKKETPVVPVKKQSKNFTVLTKPATAKDVKPVNIHDSADIDRSLYQKLTRGKLPIEAVLDLHGMGQEKALDALRRFIPQHANRGCRMVLVITGKGERLQGVLRQSLPEWLNLSDLNQHVLKVAQAQPKDGGAGAYYILLRRRKT